MGVNVQGVFNNWVGGTQPNGQKDPTTQSLVHVFQQIAYHRSTSQDGGEIRRQFIIQPASAVKSLLIALRGTFALNQDGSLARIKPHADPDFPNYYCVATEDQPLDPESVSGTATTGFVPQGPGGKVITDLNNLRSCLNVIPTGFDYDTTLAMTNTEIKACSPSYLANRSMFNQPGLDPYTSYGTNAALVTAIYRPLIFVAGLPTTASNGAQTDPFDYVDPQEIPFTKAEAIGKNLVLAITVSESALVNDPSTLGYGGVADAAIVPESCVSFSIRRLMVPFNPKNEIAGLMNKINAGIASFGSDYTFPVGTLRVGAPDVEKKLTPDGIVYYDITMNFTARRLYTSVNVPSTTTTPAFKKDWATWNHFYAQPSSSRDFIYQTTSRI